VYIYNLFTKLVENHIFYNYFHLRTSKNLKVCALHMYLQGGVETNALGFHPNSKGPFTAHSAYCLSSYQDCCTNRSELSVQYIQPIAASIVLYPCPQYRSSVPEFIDPVFAKRSPKLGLQYEFGQGSRKCLLYGAQASMGWWRILS
jgi:hypothetical protein